MDEDGIFEGGVKAQLANGSPKPAIRGFPFSAKPNQVGDNPRSSIAHQAAFQDAIDIEPGCLVTHV